MLLLCRSVWTLQSFSAGTTDERGSTGSVGDVVGAEGSAGVLVSAALCLSDTQGCHCNSQRWQFFIHAIMFNSCLRLQSVSAKAGNKQKARDLALGAQSWLSTGGTRCWQGTSVTSPPSPWPMRRPHSLSDAQAAQQLKPRCTPRGQELARGGRAARARRARLRGRVAGPSRASGARRPGPTRPTARQPSPPAERRHVAGRDPSPVGARGPWLRLVGGLDLAQRAARRCSAATRAPLLYSTSSLHLCALIAPVYAQLLRGEIESAGKDAATRPLPGHQESKVQAVAHFAAHCV